MERSSSWCHNSPSPLSAAVGRCESQLSHAPCALSLWLQLQEPPSHLPPSTRQPKGTTVPAALSDSSTAAPGLPVPAQPSPAAASPAPAGFAPWRQGPGRRELSRC